MVQRNVSGLSYVDNSVIGTRIGSLLAFGPIFGKRRHFVFECKCGKHCTTTFYDARNGKVTSCGCLRKKPDSIREVGLKPEYTSWRAMVSRCHNANDKSYPDYGGRGIKVCEEWRGEGGFFRWLAHIGRMPSVGMTQDRIDNNGNYEHGNVRWLDRKGQSANQRQRRCARLFAFGELLTFTEWSKRTGLKQTCIQERLRRGWSAEDALTKPSNKAS